MEEKPTGMRRSVVRGASVAVGVVRPRDALLADTVVLSRARMTGLEGGAGLRRALESGPFTRMLVDGGDRGGELGGE